MPGCKSYRKKLLYSLYDEFCTSSSEEEKSKIENKSAKFIKRNNNICEFFQNDNILFSHNESMLNKQTYENLSHDESKEAKENNDQNKTKQKKKDIETKVYFSRKGKNNKIDKKKVMQNNEKQLLKKMHTDEVLKDEILSHKIKNWKCRITFRDDKIQNFNFPAHPFSSVSNNKSGFNERQSTIKKSTKLNFFKKKSESIQNQNKCSFASICNLSEFYLPVSSNAMPQRKKDEDCATSKVNDLSEKLKKKNKINEKDEEINFNKCNSNNKNNQKNNNLGMVQKCCGNISSENILRVKENVKTNVKKKMSFTDKINHESTREKYDTTKNISKQTIFHTQKKVNDNEAKKKNSFDNCSDEKMNKEKQERNTKTKEEKINNDFLIKFANDENLDANNVKKKTDLSFEMRKIEEELEKIYRADLKLKAYQASIPRIRKKHFFHLK